MTEHRALPEHLPEHLEAGALLGLRHNPPRAGAWAMQRREQLFGRRTLLRPSPEHPRPAGPALLRRGELVALETWPSPAAWQPGDRVMLPVSPEGSEESDGPDSPGSEARRYVEWLLALAAREACDPIAQNPLLGPCSVAPFSADAAGTHRLWAIAVARLALPASIRVEARHDLVGVRLAQVALGFGADTLAGPITAERHLPVAGVPRPDETSITGLRKLIEQAGLECALHEDSIPRAVSGGEHTTRIKLADLGVPGKPKDQNS